MMDDGGDMMDDGDGMMDDGGDLMDDGDDMMDDGGGKTDVLCTDTCGSMDGGGGDFAGDGECDDGGPGSIPPSCALGTDCTDCGPRVVGDESIISSPSSIRSPPGYSNFKIDTLRRLLNENTNRIVFASCIRRRAAAMRGTTATPRGR